MSEADHWLCAGVVGRPHGLDGSFHVIEPVPGLLELGALVSVQGANREIVRAAGHERRPILRLAGCEDRDAAQRLGGAELRVSRQAAPPLQEDEWWADDLQGCTVRDGDRVVGVVARLLGLPSCEVLEVTRETGRPDLLVPLIKDAVRGVDLEQRVINVDLRFLGEA